MKVKLVKGIERQRKAMHTIPGPVRSVQCPVASDFGGSHAEIALRVTFGPTSPLPYKPIS